MNLILYKIYYILARVRMNNSEIKNFKFKFSHKLIGYLESWFNLFMPKLYRKYPSKKYGLNTKERKEKIIVSLTSFPARIDTLWITIESLFRQSMKADEIILWLANNQFDGLESLPKELFEQQKRGLEIKFCDDLRSHKKYYYTMQEYPNDCVILVDDDVILSSDMIKELWEMHLKNPNNICSMISAVIDPSVDALPSTWRKPYKTEKLYNTWKAQPYSGQGTLYPPRSIPKEAFNKGLIRELCPLADDLWLKFMSLKNGVNTTSIYPYRNMPINIYGTAESSLYWENVQNNKNDEQWTNLINYYPEDFKRMEQEYENSR